jgi:exosortase A
MRQLFERLPFLSLLGIRRARPHHVVATGNPYVEQRARSAAAPTIDAPDAVPHEGADIRAESKAIESPTAPSVVAIAAVSLVACGMLALYWRTAESIVAIWLRSETFAHGFVVIPICLWLVWRRRHALAEIPVTPWWPALAGVFAAGALWLVASAADALGVKQFALVFMIQAGIIAVVGKRMARALVFPIAFLLFAVPAGEIFVPTLIDRTADFTVSALRWSGVPVYREANHFLIPSGAWSVVEACSGIRYIIASLMVGTIYAAVAYQSVGRRVAFIGASIVVPIIANWFRAYMIVMLAHLTNNKLAVGVDHIIYGWVFFGVVMLLLFWVGSFWQETEKPPAAASARSSRAAEGSVRFSSRALFAAAIAAVMLAAIWLPIEGVVARPVSTDTPALAPLAAESGWIPAGKPFTEWKPHYKGYASDLSQIFTRDNRTVGLYLAYFRNQEKGRELITSGNLLVSMEDWKWRQLAASSGTVDWTGVQAPAQRAEISGSQDESLVAYRLYWVNGTMTSSDYVAKALIAWSKLRGLGDDSALIVAYSLQRAQDSDKVLREFISSMSRSIERTLETTRRAAK